MGGRVLRSGESESGVRTKRLKLSGKTSSEAGRLPREPGDLANDPAHSDALSFLPRPDRWANLLGCEEPVGRQRALDREQPLQVLGRVSSNVRRRPRSSVTVSPTAERPTYRTSTSRIVVVGVSAL